MLTKLELSEQERIFIDYFFKETSTATAGPVVNWLNQQGVKFYEMYPLEKLRWQEDPELMSQVLSLPDREILIPWQSSEELRSRISQVRKFLDEWGH